MKKSDWICVACLAMCVLFTVSMVWAATATF